MIGMMERFICWATSPVTERQMIAGFVVILLGELVLLAMALAGVI